MTFAVRLEQIEEGEPFVAIFFFGRPTSGGVEQDGVVGQPPVAVARAADALEPVARAREVRELEPRVAQDRGLAARGRADDGVPGQPVERVARRALTARQLGALQGVDRATRST